MINVTKKVVTKVVKLHLCVSLSSIPYLAAGKHLDSEFGKSIQWELEQELAGCAGILKTTNTTKLLTLPYKMLTGMVNATEINAAGREEPTPRRAGRDG